MAAFDHAFASQKVIIMAAPNGARRTYEDHPALPITPAELADTAESLLDAGVSVLHLHVRDEDGRHSLDAKRNRAAIAAVRERVGERLILQITTEAVGRYSREQQMAVVRELRPEAVSLGLIELCPDEGAESESAAFFAWLVGEGIWPQYILYSADDVRRFDEMRRRGVFADDRPFCLFVLGRYSESLEGAPEELDAMLGAVDCAAFPWAVCCFGRRENDAMLEATGKGGHVRLGFENNLLLCDGTKARDNAALIRQFRESATGRLPATADDIRNQWPHP